MRFFRRRFGSVRRLAVLLVAMNWISGCADARERPDAYLDDESPSSAKLVDVDRCGEPAEGCPCSEPGTSIDCGRVTVKIDEYTTCFEGSRLCGADGTWGACEADQDVADALSDMGAPSD
ncbi:MAG: hypothetical protein QM784_24915 [Polyangiaceae bacterium]